MEKEQASFIKFHLFTAVIYMRNGTHSYDILRPSVVPKCT